MKNETIKKETTVPNVVFITGNPKKAAYLSEHFHMKIDRKEIDLPEIQSLSLREVVEDKARRAFEEVHSPVLVEDVSLVFNALGSLPGPFIKWFERSLGYEGLCRMLDGHADRSAVATVAYAYCDQEGVRVFESEMRGSIGEHPKGESAFGWDVIFCHEGDTRTRAELPELEWAEKSMRNKALRELGAFLGAASKR